MIKDILNKLEELNGELEILYSRIYEDEEYLEFSLKSLDYKDISLKLSEEEGNILKFLLIYRIVDSSESELTNRLSKTIILDNENLISLIYKMKKDRVDLEKSIEDILKFRKDDLIKDIIEAVRNNIEPMDTYSLININIEELYSVLVEDYTVESFKLGRYKIFSSLAEGLIEDDSEGENYSVEEIALMKATTFSLALRNKESLYNITKDIIREMTKYINEKLDLDSKRLLEGIRNCKNGFSYNLIKSYDSNTLVLEEEADLYEKLDLALFIITFLYQTNEVEEEDKIEELEEVEEIEEVGEMEENIENFDDKLIEKEMERFSKIIPSAKQMTERYYNLRKEIIDNQFEEILELLNKVYLERSIEVEFLLIEEVEEYLLSREYSLEVKGDKTIISW